MLLKRGITPARIVVASPKKTSSEPPVPPPKVGAFQGALGRIGRLAPGRGNGNGNGNGCADEKQSLLPTQPPPLTVGDRDRKHSIFPTPSLGRTETTTTTSGNSGHHGLSNRDSSPESTEAPGTGKNINDMASAAGSGTLADTEGIVDIKVKFAFFFDYVVQTRLFFKKKKTKTPTGFLAAGPVSCT